MVIFVKNKRNNNVKMHINMKIRIDVLILLIIDFAAVWTDIFFTSMDLKNQLDSMIEGKDYHVEEILITKKDFDTYSPTADSGTDTINYFFYYNNSSQKKMQVSEAVYKKYCVGDKIPAYTTDHVNYFYKKECLLPERKDNELKKCIGITLGAAVLGCSIWMWIAKK